MSTCRAPIIMAAVVGAAMSGPVAHAAPGDTTLASRASGPAGAKGNLGSAWASISGNGRFVAFMSDASNLHADDGDSETDVFVRDRFTGATILVSRASGAAGEKGDGSGSSLPAISADGAIVAFASNATNLAPEDRDRDQDVFARGVYGTKTVLVSRASGGAKANGHSTPLSISANGRYVAFASTATNLDPSDPDPTHDVYVRDLQANTTVLVSRASGTAGAHANGASSQASISADGRLVAFASRANNLSKEDGNTQADVYVRDLQAHTTTLVSRAAGGGTGNRASHEPALSADGRCVAFASNATNLSPDDPEPRADVYVRDLQARTTTLVSRADGAAGVKGDDHSRDPSISSDGRRVAFVSTAGNLVADTSGGVAHVYVRDRQTHTTALASRASGASGAPGDSTSILPALSGDGLSVAFDSNATNLSPADGDRWPDVYVRDLPRG